MTGDRAAPLAGVPKDVTRDELSLAFRVIEALRGMRFGSVQLQVHDGRSSRSTWPRSFGCTNHRRGRGRRPCRRVHRPDERGDGMHAVMWLLVVLMLEIVVGLVLLGTWVAEGRRRAEEIERIAELLRRAPAFTDGVVTAERSPAGSGADTA